MTNCIKLTFSGDIMCSEAQKNAAKKNGTYDFSPVFQNVSKILSDSDYLCGNLETPIAPCCRASTDANFSTPPEFLDSLVEAGFNFVSTANNHALDEGVEGLLSTIDELKKRSLDYTGTFDSAEISNRYLSKKIENLNVAFLSYTYGANSEHHGRFLDSKNNFMLNIFRKQPQKIDYENSPKEMFVLRAARKIARTLGIWPKDINKGRKAVLDNSSKSDICDIESNRLLEQMLFEIEKAKKQHDIVILCLHIGGQYNSRLGSYSKYVFNRLLQSKVDVVIGNHPHCMLPCIYKKNKVLAISLGNFSYTPGSPWELQNVYANYSALLSINIDKLSKRIRSVSYRLLIVAKNELGYSCTYPAYDFICSQSNELVRKKMISDYKHAAKRIAGKSVDEFKPEYFINIE